MLRYIIERLLIMVPTLAIISFLVFAIIQAPPGDYLETMIAELQSQGEEIAKDKIDFLRKNLRLG